MYGKSHIINPFSMPNQCNKIEIIAWIMKTYVVSYVKHIFHELFIKSHSWLFQKEKDIFKDTHEEYVHNTSTNVFKTLEDNKIFEAFHYMKQFNVIFNNTYQLVVNLPKSKYTSESSKLKSITHKILLTLDEKCGLSKWK
jgi:hypothetical protein